MALYKKILILVILLSSMGLFYIRGLGSLVRVMDIVAVSLIIVHLLLFISYGKQEPIKKSFSIPVIFILLGVIVSALPAYAINNQGLGISFYQQRHMYAFLFYFLLLYAAPNPRWIVNLLFITAIVWSLFFLIQYIIYPVRITDAKIFLQRGTIRMNLPGSFILPIGYFISINKFFTTYNKRYGVVAFLIFIVALLSGFRSILSVFVIITVVYVIINKEVRNKLLLFALTMVVIVASFFAFQEMFVEMKESAEREGSQGTSYIRFRAAEYFIKESKKDNLTIFFGNGEPSERSGYGRRLIVNSFRNGYYISDIGIVGFYYKFGMITSFFVLLIIIRILFIRMHADNAFIKMFFIYQLFLILNSRLSFDSLPNIIFVCMLLYIIDYQNTKSWAPSGNLQQGGLQINP